MKFQVSALNIFRYLPPRSDRGIPRHPGQGTYPFPLPGLIGGGREGVPQSTYPPRSDGGGRGTPRYLTLPAKVATPWPGLAGGGGVPQGTYPLPLPGLMGGGRRYPKVPTP